MTDPVYHNSPAACISCVLMGSNFLASAGGSFDVMKSACIVCMASKNGHVPRNDISIVWPDAGMFGIGEW